MPTYVVTAPDGKEYEITAPEGATQEQVLAYAQQNYSKPAEKPQRSLAQETGRQLGLTARAGITGLASLPAMLAEPVACLLYTSPSPRDKRQSRMPSSA